MFSVSKAKTRLGKCGVRLDVALRALRVPLASAMCAAALCVGVVNSAHAAAALPCGDAVDAVDLERRHQWLEKINAIRAAGASCPGRMAIEAAPPLEWNAKLGLSARLQAVDLAERGLIAHTDAAGRRLAERLQRVAYRARLAGENLASGYSDLDSVLAAWLASPSHCPNLMRRDATSVGLACRPKDGDPGDWVWVFHMGAAAAPERSD